MTESIIVVNQTESMPTFKNAALADATKRIKDIIKSAFEYAEEKNTEISKILGKVKVEKSYVDDGYKSVDDYAQKVFGINRSSAFAMAAAGEIYNSDTSPESLKKLSYSKLAELARADKDAVEKALSDGTITPETTQKALRDFANQHKAKSVDDASGGASDAPLEANVEKTYKVRVLSDFMALNLLYDGVVEVEQYWDTQLSNAAFEGPEQEQYTVGDMKVYHNASFRKAEILKLPKCQHYLTPNSKKKPVMRKAYVTDVYAIVAEFYEAKAEEKQTLP